MKKPNINTINPGEFVFCTGFTCIPNNAKRTVFSNGLIDKNKFICCSHGHHFLDGQADENGDLIGISYEPFSNSISKNSTEA